LLLDILTLLGKPESENDKIDGELDCTNWLLYDTVVVLLVLLFQKADQHQHKCQELLSLLNVDQLSPHLLALIK